MISDDDDDVTRVLDPDGEVVGDVPDLSDETLVEMYRDMRLVRRFDERAVSLQRQGRLGTYAPVAGQEAASVASTHALTDDDWVVYQYREHGAVAVRGLTPAYLTYWMGHENGNAALVEDRIAPLNISIASQIPHAVGMAWASKLRGDANVVVCHFGDGATSEGDFHEGMNFAGVFDVPAVMFCNNNRWAISHPRERQTASETLAVKAEAYGFEGVRVDGMDPLAVYRVTRDAVAKARGETDADHRPTMIEADMYRFGAHTTADDPSVYRDEDEVEAWRERDPLRRFEAYLRDRGLLDDDAVESVESEVEETLADVIATAEAYEADPLSMFDHAFADLPPEVVAQRESFAALLGARGSAAFRGEE